MVNLLSTKDLAVGYNRKILINGINISLEKGKILTLIGPNGAGKSTVLKTITRQLQSVSGNIFIGSQPINNISGKDFARQTAVVLTERIHPELMTCAELVAMGRYPYTNLFGSLTEHDKSVVTASLERVHALDLAEKDFSTLSDGQRQRIMLARAICQEPEIIVLDEPTAYLDIRYKIELLSILRDMAREQGTAVVMSLHEIDLAMKISDEILCLDGERITAYGSPDTIYSSHEIERLFDLESGSYNLLFGSVELPKAEGKPEVFVIAGNGKGTPLFRKLQRQGIPFAAGILFENDVDCQTADVLSIEVVKAPAFQPIPDNVISKAAEIISGCGYVLDAGTDYGNLSYAKNILLDHAEKNGIPIMAKLKGTN